MGKEQVIWSPCVACNKETMHKIVYQHHDDAGEDYHADLAYMIIKCQGCGRASFRYVFTDYENAYPISDEAWDVPKEVITYPKIIPNHSGIFPEFYLPNIVCAVYSESLIAIREGTSILAGMGLRGTIEAICNDRSIEGRSLDKRISKLASEGLISKKDSERLHAIRFLGNDAAHDITKPTDQQITTALKIIEHLIASLYILDAEAHFNLDTVITEYSEFTKALGTHLRSFTEGDEYPLAKYLGKDVRRLVDGLSKMEAELMAEIRGGNYTKLSIGKMDAFGNSPKQVQHFIICRPSS